MQVDIITLFPELFDALNYGITGRAINNKLINPCCWNPRDYTNNPHRNVDDKPYGGGAGMVMAVEPLQKAIQAARSQQQQPGKTIYLSPQGKPLKQADVAQFAQQSHVILVAGRYEGIDERLIELEIDEQWSVGDYVLSGGEIPALLLIDAITRLLPGAVGDADSVAQDSFSDGLLDYPHYTRPQQISGLSVPEVLCSGDHQAIATWRKQQSLLNTWQKRPDLLKRRVLTDEEQKLLDQAIAASNHEEKQ